MPSKDYCYCSEYASSGLPCLPGTCPNAPREPNALKTNSVYGKLASIAVPPSLIDLSPNYAPCIIDSEVECLTLVAGTVINLTEPLELAIIASRYPCCVAGCTHKASYFAKNNLARFGHICFGCLLKDRPEHYTVFHPKNALRDSKEGDSEYYCYCCRQLRLWLKDGLADRCGNCGSTEIDVDKVGSTRLFALRYGAPGETEPSLDIRMTACPNCGEVGQSEPDETELVCPDCGHDWQVS